MSRDDPAVKVLCGTRACGRLLCRVIATPQGLVYKVNIGSRGAWADSPAGVFCPDHGWPDLTGPALAAEVARAQRSGKVGTHRAVMMPRAPSRQ